jgi:hypothetical protein
MQVIGVTGVNDSYMAACETVLMRVLLMPCAFAHRDPPGCKGIEFETPPLDLRLALLLCL